ncbi:GNAT family N-acetyltransferase [Antarcticibacterium arcticum]|uniref:GNAT family N-acetyltransferase n=1 Tax=Antarcticibacterium arcticum TaxID=2585771 RepID=A0A5B8YLX2_9FLAO|nr:GNAT family N-acetyltransferase [Antarcticibacterium arcticum]QED39010.1 GNAT family N-acetyltransferase [Antarcticibacterium arcticum]
MHLQILPFCLAEVETLAQLSRKTFIESHGHSAAEKDIQAYADLNFSLKKLEADLQDPRIFFHKVLVNDQIAGYSKLILNEANSHTSVTPLAKFERLYLLKEFYGLGLGEKLLELNVEIARSHKQNGLWLYVWTENIRGLRFYQKSNFKSIGKYNFKISEQHSNPNFVMLKILSGN